MFSRVLTSSGVLSRRVSRPTARIMVMVLAAGMVSAVPSPTYAADHVRPQVQDLGGASAQGRALPGKPRPDNPAERAALGAAPTVAWPAAAVAQIEVRDAVATSNPLAVGPEIVGSTGSVTPARAGGMPVGVAPTAGSPAPTRVRLEVLPREASARAGVAGPVLRVARADSGQAAAPVRVTLNYRDFADAYGGDFGSRLRLVRLPDCALTTPDITGCRTATPLRSTNNTATDTVSADVLAAGTAGGGVYALMAGETSSQGSYAATKLAPSSKWSVAPSSGAFSWSYPLRTPPTPGGLVPQVAFSYSSQSVDGRTAATNNQGSWIGEGFGYEPGYIERRYKPCADDGHETSADQCWAFHNATVVLEGSSGELIKDASGRWRMTTDSDWRIEALAGATNNDDNGEYWRITTTDGTQYSFGLNQLPGWTNGKEETNSAWTVPVYGDDSGEPCYNATFANAWCKQAWRWNLDYVKDVHGNVTSYFYGRESNWYARGARTDVDGTEYHRGGWLKRVDYGQRDNAVYTTNAPARVVFDTAERCLPSGTITCAASQLTDATANHWPDVPWDRNCAPETHCKLDQASPSFWTRKRLTKITTQIRSATDWVPVDSWSLDHWLTDNADGSKTLWLNKITHAGHVGGTASVPAVQLIGEQLPNRIDKPDDNIDNLIRFRVNTIITDTSGQIHVDYEDPDCSASNLPAAGESTRRCYPVKWNPSNGNPLTDWFHKYVVREVKETDRTGGAPDMVTRYEYLNGTAWRKAKPDGITKSEYLTWGEWRGYGKVRITRGDGQFMTTKTEHVYMRGMDGDPQPAGGTRDITVSDSTGGSYDDTDEFGGHELETTVYNGSAVVSKSINVPWLHETGTNTIDGGPSRRSVYVKPGSTRTYVALEAGGFRQAKVEYTYDTSHGRLIATNDLGNVAENTDDRCSRSYFADSLTAWIYSLPSRTETVAVNCGATPNRATQMISDSRTFYDGGTFGSTPTKGDPTHTEKLASHNGTTATYVTVADSTFDQWGRPLTVKDAAASTTTTVYTHTNGLITKKEETGPISTAWKTTTEYAPAWGLPTAQVDFNSKRADLEYDALGRLTNVWLPDRSKAQGLTPSIKYGYKLVADQPVAVKTEKIRIDGGYSVQYELYDGLLRPRQIQAEGPENGRLVTDTYYGGTGQIVKFNDAYHAAGAPTDQIMGVDNGEVDGQTLYQYDGADRVTAQIFAVAGEEKWRTTTSYGGDRVHSDPPAGGVPTTMISDALNRTTELWQYKGSAPTGAHDTTTYTYTPTGQMATLTDPAGNVWRHTYDQRGRKIESKDPDTGTTTYRYDDLDRLTYTKDGRGAELTTAYDKLGRKTDLYQGATTSGTKLARWTYDTIAKGQLYSSIRIVNGKNYAVVYPLRDALYRPLKVQYIIPSEPGAEQLARTYEFTTSYNRDGTVQGLGLPEAGGLPAEAVVYNYDDLQRPTSMTGLTPYVSQPIYGQTGELLQLQLTTGAKKAWLTWEYEEGTKRLARSRLDRETVPFVDIDAHYSYDPAGNIRSIADTPSGGERDVQCFSYDYLRRLTEAWSTTNTASDPCAGGPGATGVGGPAAYHHSYEFSSAGNRTKETIHGIGTASDITRDYTYPAAGQPQPHALSQVVEHTPTGDRLSTYVHDDAGNTTGRNLVGTSQTLNWDPEGHLASVVTGGQTTSFVYDADGNRLVRKEPGATTLYLPGTQLSLNHATGAVNGVRFYSFAGQTVAARGGTGVSFLASDHLGTQDAIVDAQTGAITRRRTAPFGEVRGADPGAWPGDQGFVGGTKDPTTGLTHLGAREYDPKIGQFISADPVFTTSDPTQFNAYQYARHNPVTFSDPTGLMLPAEGGGGSSPSSSGCAGGGMSSFCSSPYGSYGGQWGPPGSSQAGRPVPSADEVALAEARAKQEQAKQKLKEAAKALLKIAMDELGITDALDCVTKGDFGACAETFINIATSFVGGIAAKLARKYGLPWNWKKGVDLVKRIWNIAGDLIDGAKNWFKNSKLVRQLEGALGKGGCNSFVPGTMVLLANGKRKPIEQVRVGDRVVATDPVSRAHGAKTVAATIIGSGSKNLVKVTIDLDGARGGSTGDVIATAGHPFWVPDPGIWTPARSLAVGQWLLTGAGTWVQITAIERWTEPRTVYNLTVADIHTYYVIAGSTPVLVHNDDIPRNPDGTFASGAGGESADTARGRQTHLNYRTALGGEYDYEHRLPSGGRPDALHWENREIRELKSDAPSSQSEGRRQLARYQAELELETGDKWSTHLDTYKRFCNEK
jgi:RHS repeat-associated protein